MERILQTIIDNPRFAEKERDLIVKAFNFGLAGHEGQKRFSGEDYFIHPVAVAAFLSDLGLDTKTICAGLLHDTIEDTHITLEILEKEFGKEPFIALNSILSLNKVNQVSCPNHSLI